MRATVRDGMTLDSIEAYKRDGYTVFPGYLSSDEVSARRIKMDPELELLFPNERTPPVRGAVVAEDGATAEGQTTGLPE